MIKYAGIACAGVAALMSTAAMAAGVHTNASIGNLPEEGMVTLSGTVDSVNNDQEFTLRDRTGTIDVDIESGQSLNLKKGDHVTVTGKIDNDITGTDINATNIQVMGAVQQGLNDAANAVQEGAETAYDKTARAIDSAAGAATIDNLPEEGMVTLSGTVESINNDREFTLRDQTGTIDVDIESGQSMTLKKGDQVTVTGKIDDDITGTDINATRIEVSKGLTQDMNDAVKSIPGVSTGDAQAYNIKDLPDEGMVKISGTVSDVDNEKEFTLKDRTGSINIDVEAPESALVTEGAEVTVIGQVNSGMLGKDINATKVMVVANAPRAAH